MAKEWSEYTSEDFWSDSIEAIAMEFEIPRLTAASWERNIGDVDHLKETLGKSGPDNYIELIRRREWIPREREKREDEYLEPLKRWYTKNADGVYLVHESDREDFRNHHRSVGMQSIGIGSGWRAIALTDESTKRREADADSGISWTEQIGVLREELERKEDWVKYEMRRADPEWIGLTRERRRIDKELIEIYRSHLRDDEKEFQYKKDEIIELKRAFPYLRANANLVAEATDSSVSYVKKFKHYPDEGVASRRVKGKRRDEVLERDGTACVSCGCEEDLEVHHIIPRDRGGENAKDNLATLCADCHYYAHGGGEPTGENRFTAAVWNSVEYAGQDAFWDEWIHQSFDERVSKDFTRSDPQVDGRV